MNFLYFSFKKTQLNLTSNFKLYLQARLTLSCAMLSLAKSSQPIDFFGSSTQPPMLWDFKKNHNSLLCKSNCTQRWPTSSFKGSLQVQL